MGANGDASEMAISSADDLRGERHADDPVTPDMPRCVMRAPASRSPCSARKSPTRAQPTFERQSRRET